MALRRECTAKTGGGFRNCSPRGYTCVGIGRRAHQAKLLDDELPRSGDPRQSREAF